MSQDDKPWGGRFSEATDAFVETFTASVGFDRRLYHYDIQGSIAHANMLGATGIISADERASIVAGLQQIHKEIDSDAFEWRTSLEDVHMNVESRLVELIGDTGKKLHTARSRNDQVATDLRLYLRAEVDELIVKTKSLMTALLDQAERHAGTIMPGFTHLQTAQPITFGHHLLAWFEMLSRDLDRLVEARARINVLPLGSAALAGTTFPIDRQRVAAELGFARPSENSLDAVSDRDFVIEFCAAASLMMMHLSRWSEELVLWMSEPFSFVDLPDRFCTGSSIMPQKKNPDVPELIRGKTGRVFGNLMGLLTLMKGQPLTYNKDNQEDKEPLFDTVDTLNDALTAFIGIVPAIEANADNMLAAAARGFATATDLADHLVRSGMAFRDAHEVVGRTVSYAIQHNKALDELTLDELRTFHPGIQEDVYDVLTLEGSVTARNHVGATAPSQVLSAVARARRTLGR
jgi:argininosuccinate lyase